MKRNKHRNFSLIISVVLLAFSSLIFSQDTIKVVSYNLLNYPNNYTQRDQNFRTVMDSINPNIIVVQEILSFTGVNLFLNNVLNHDGTEYNAGDFINGPDTDNAIFYRDSDFMFISNNPISTSLRDISEFELVHLQTNDTLIIYSVHLKASQSDAQRRAEEVESLRAVTD
jgi:hypothetical protein